MLTNEKLEEIRGLEKKLRCAATIPPSSNSPLWIGLDWGEGCEAADKGYNFHDLKPIMREYTPEEFKRLYLCDWPPESKEKLPVTECRLSGASECWNTQGWHDLKLIL
ncbi:hypothetical protein EH203_05300 [Pectobacterium carotovorum subsp. carotovorum]|uniref:hypothetical protein n=1 Tax=Pectobacterium carotovorum TaxID=554 RepID=UPI0013746076|nr:hypothetical protein [Pectobacterium carotovorum]QHP53309.1 hypothetical protein EH203_05300 [Pectobacterium carotovorum subsp. carotovorum]